MALPQIHTQADVVKHAVALLTQGTPEDWNRHYRTREFQRVAAEKGGKAVYMDFDYANRRMLYQCVNDRFVGNRAVDYLEFGVAGGESLRAWTDINRDPGSRFFGFDSFEGLPEDWTSDAPKGTFSRNGTPPAMDDPRVEFVPGLFQDTVESFSRDFAPRNRLVIHMDADLYSSTLFCLMHLNRHIVPGAIILFDEFAARNFTDEFAALQDYCSACYREYGFLAARRDFAKLAIEITQ